MMNCPNCKSDHQSKIDDYQSRHKIFSNLSLVECDLCKLVFADPMPSKHQLDAYYNNYWNGDVATVSPSTKQYYLAQAVNRVDYLQRYMQFSRTLKILDVGAGPGVFLDGLNHLSIFADYYAVEPDIQQRSDLSMKSGVKGTYSSIEDVENDLKFDLIIISHVLEHVVQPHDFLTKITILLNPKGHVYIEVPNKDYEYKHEIEPHVLFFNIESLADCIEQHGKLLQVESFGQTIESLQSAKSNTNRKNKTFQTIEKLVNKIILAFTIDKSRQLSKMLEMNTSGDKRQWLRAIIQLGK